MRVPIAWLRAYVDIALSTDELAEVLARAGFPVDNIERRPALSGVVAGRIATLARHPNADRLQVAQVNVGGSSDLQIATAATNVAVGQTIPIATVGARLANATIERRTMRGLESHGMMGSADELALPAEWFEDGILQLDGSAAPGSDILAQLGLNDDILEVDITPNRPDALSMIGIAREVAAATGQTLRLPATEVACDGESDVNVTIETPDCRRFVAVSVRGVKIGPAPLWMRVRLALAGQRPINNAVDISNYVMLETGQPLHFYDYDKIANHHLIVRDGKSGERLKTLDGAEHTLSADALVIAGEHGAQGLAGLRGGAEAEVSENTSQLFIESANFNGARVRRMSRGLGLRTDASTRHEKALAPALTDFAAARAAVLLREQGARPQQPKTFGAALPEPPVIVVAQQQIERYLGYLPTQEEALQALAALGFTADSNGTDLWVRAPEWRTDIALDVDVIEEIARALGYDRIPSVLPAIASHEIPSDEYHRERDAARTLASLGYREIITFALQPAEPHERIAKAIGTPAKPAEVTNPLSQDQRFLRSSLLPGLLQHFAQYAKHGPQRVFEIGRIFGGEQTGGETPAVAFAFSIDALDEPEWRDSAFSRIKGDAQYFLRALSGQTSAATASTPELMHPGKTAALALDGNECAVAGAVDPRVCAAFETERAVYAAIAWFDRIPAYRVPRYRPVARFPAVRRDLAVVVDEAMTAAGVTDIVESTLGPACASAKVFDEYRGEQIPRGKKSLAMHVELQGEDGTMTDAEADAALERAIQALEEAGAVLRR